MGSTLVPDRAEPPAIDVLARRVRAAAVRLASAPPQLRQDALVVAADQMELAAPDILRANQLDLERAEHDGLGPTAVDRLRLTEGRIGQMADALRDVSALPDPVGEVVDGWVRANGLRVERVRVPLGVVGIIYENRPNVTSDAAALCLRSGNAAFLRGSASALNSNKAVVTVLRRALQKVGLPEEAVTLVEDTSHETAIDFMRLRGLIDCLVPRGGRALIQSLIEHATVPYVLDGDGNCHIYIDAHADLEQAIDIVANAKMQRPGVCNAAESLLVHRDVAAALLPRLAETLEDVELVGDEGARSIVDSMGIADEEAFATEFLGPKMSVAVVDDLDGAISHIARFGSGHSEAIVTTNLLTAERFITEVDAAAVLVNASTRFIDGGELGLGAEVGISTQKLHCRGPMGLRELTCVKWVVRGNGQVRS